MSLFSQSERVRAQARIGSPPSPCGGGNEGEGERAGVRAKQRKKRPSSPAFAGAGSVLLPRGEGTRGLSGCALFIVLLGNSEPPGRQERQVFHYNLLFLAALASWRFKIIFILLGIPRN